MLLYIRICILTYNIHMTGGGGGMVCRIRWEIKINQIYHVASYDYIRYIEIQFETLKTKRVCTSNGSLHHYDRLREQGFGVALMLMFAALAISAFW